jgi:hypothetical protein
MLTGILLMTIGSLVVALAVCVAIICALSAQIERFRAREHTRRPEQPLDQGDLYA